MLQLCVSLQWTFVYTLNNVRLFSSRAVCICSAQFQYRTVIVLFVVAGWQVTTLKIADDFQRLNFLNVSTVTWQRCTTCLILVLFLMFLLLRQPPNVSSEGLLCRGSFCITYCVHDMLVTVCPRDAMHSTTHIHFVFGMETYVLANINHWLPVFFSLTKTKTKTSSTKIN